MIVKTKPQFYVLLRLGPNEQPGRAAVEGSCPTIVFEIQNSMVQWKEFRKIQTASAVGLIALAAIFITFMTISAFTAMPSRLDAPSLV